MRVLYFADGLLAYASFVGTIVYSVGFVTNALVPKSIDSGAAISLPQALTIDLALLLAFAVQHSAMARTSRPGGCESLRRRSSAAPTC
jgi:protein-S-isoprenylcysteine O-methyltransferase Ste14